MGMKYCPACGGFAQDNQLEVERHDPNCNLFDGQVPKDREWHDAVALTADVKKPAMLPVTTANRFCAFCNKIFAAEVTSCRHCGRETYQMTEAHLKSYLVLSGLGAVKEWDSVV
ncbi:MAG TPA: hypothetical protein VMD74_00195 [Candidatus Methylomirabilis sp.]|nr:hypothetical protein [Candidatus Methylomirabilis sp.]